MTEGYSLSDIATATGSNRNNDGMWGGDFGAWIILFLIFGMFGWGGFGGGYGNAGFGGGANGSGFQGWATRADITEGFALNNLQSGITAIQQGICDSTYALNNTITNGFNATQMSMMQGFNGVNQGFCNLSSQLAQCCCDNKAAIADVKYQMATDTCAVQNTINNTTRDILENQNANTRALLDFMVQDKISTLQAENQNLKLAASQANQNAVLMAAMDANTAQIIRRTGNDCPIPAYVVNPPTPQTFCGNGYNQVSACNCNNQNYCNC